MGPKILCSYWQGWAAYTVRILPLGGYVRMWLGRGFDNQSKQVPASLTLNEDGKVVRINLSGKISQTTALLMNVTSFWFWRKAGITGLVLDEAKTYSVDHDGTIVEEDGTEFSCSGCAVSKWLVSGDSLPTLRVLWTFIPEYYCVSLLAFMQGGQWTTTATMFELFLRIGG